MGRLCEKKIVKVVMGRIIGFQSKDELKSFLIRNIKIDKKSVRFFLDKSTILYFYFKNISNQICNIIKQEMISVGGDAAVSKEVGQFKKGKSDILIFGTEKNLSVFVNKSKYQIRTIKNIGADISEYLNKIKSINVFKVGRKVFDNNKTFIMGILNTTPDSFYDGGKYLDKDSALKRAVEMAASGADIIDIGGESSRPGARKISVKEELKRILPVLKMIRKKIKIPISVDTYKSEVADIVLSEGADIINDISGLKFDKNLANTVARHKASIVLMHIKGTPKNMQNNPAYTDLMQEIINYLQESISIAESNNIKFEKIMIDPGIGFGKSLKDNYVILNKLSELKILNRPVLVGLSRKSLIGKILNNNPDDRLIGSAVLNAAAVLNGVNFIRVHDVKENRDMLKVVEYLQKKGVYN